MELSDKTLLEMETGAKQLAAVNGTALEPGYMDGIIRTQQRHSQLTKWERDRKVEIETTSSFVNGTPTGNTSLIHRTVIHVLDDHHLRWMAFDDILAEKVGGWPSEVLMANVALALQSKGLL